MHREGGHREGACPKIKRKILFEAIAIELLFNNIPVDDVPVILWKFVGQAYPWDKAISVAEKLQTPDGFL